MWNYRICTRLVNQTRTYFILPVYYDIQGKISSYGEQYLQVQKETVEDLLIDFKNRLEAFERDAIDLDNFPSIYYDFYNSII